MIDIKKFIKGLRILNNTDQTKSLELSVNDSSTTNTKTTIETSQTANRTVTLPDATDTLAGISATQTLTNKSIDADSNTITNIENADIKAGAAIARNKLATGTIDRVLVNDGSGNISDSSVTTNDLNVLSGLSGETLVTTDNTQTLTNKTIDADSNTISNIENADIKAGAAIDATKIADGSVTSTEFQYINSLTSNAQDQIDSKVAKAGDTMTGFLTLNADPTSALHAVTKQYADSISAGLDPKEAVRAATTADLGFTYNTSPSNGQFTSVGGALMVDGVSLATNDRLLVKDQTDAKENGIYTYDSAAQTLTRSADMDGSPAAEVSSGNFTFVIQGTDNAAKGFVVLGNGILTLNVDDISLSQFSGAANAALRDLSNLTSPTAINQDLLPDTNNTKDVGSVSLTYAEGHINNVDAQNVRTAAGSTTIDVTNRKLIDSAASDAADWENRILKSGATTKLDWSGTDLSVNNRKIQFLTSPVSPLDVANKVYVDNAVSRNYILNGTGDIETSPTGWVAYSDAAGTSPVDGTGGSPNVTITTFATNPLEGARSFLLTKDAANRQGQGVSYDFTIDAADKSKILQISFDYIVNSGTFVAGSPSTDSDVTIWIYDVTNSTIIQPTTYKLFSNSSTTPDRFMANFQSTTSTSYRLILHVGSTSASFYELKFDRVKIQPTTYSLGTLITDWVDGGQLGITATTTNPTKGTTAVDKVWYRRVGGNLEVRYEYRQTGSGSAGSGDYLFSVLPAGLTIDTTKVTVYSTLEGSGNWTTNNAVGGGFLTDSNAGSVGMTAAFVYDSTKFRIGCVVANGGTAGTSVVNSASVGLGNAAAAYSGYLSVPVLGWSSQTITSDVSDQRIVVARYKTAAGQVVTGVNSKVILDFGTKDTDTHAAVTTGASWKFTAPIAGIYRVSAMVALTDLGGGYSTNQKRIYIFKNNTQTIVLDEQFTVNGQSMSCVFNGSTTIQLNAGDFIDLRGYDSSSGETLTMQSDNQKNWIDIERLSNPAILSATETIEATYYANAAKLSGPAQPFDFDTKVTDTHGAVTTGASWKFTAPIAGFYQVSSCTNVSASVYLDLYKNGVEQTPGLSFGNGTFSGTRNIKLNAGDYIDIRYSASNNSNNFPKINYVSIKRIGI